MSASNSVIGPGRLRAFRASTVLLAAAFLVVVATGGVASAHGHRRQPTSTTTHEGSAKKKSEKRMPVLEAGVLYRPAASQYGGFGNGEVRPKSISTSGVGATNGVTKIVWKSWGKKTATGVGSGCVLGHTGIEANCRVTRAKVVAYDLGTCAGRRAYLAVTWYFPSLGQKVSKKGTVPNPSCHTKVPAEQSTTTTSGTSSPTSTSPPSTSTTTSTPAPASSAAAPCTTATMTAAAQASTSTFYSITGFGCAGDYAYAFVTVTGTNGQPIAEITDVFQATNSSWHAVSRSVCTSGAVPPTIFQQACETN